MELLGHARACCRPRHRPPRGVLLVGLPGRSSGAAAGHRRRGRPSARCRPAGRTERPRRGRAAARGRLHPGPHRDARRPVLRVRDRRHASGRARHRLAGQRLGPELRTARHDPGAHRRRGHRDHLAGRPARAPGRVRDRVRHRRHHGERDGARLRPRRGAPACGLGRLARRAQRRPPGARAGRRGTPRHDRPGAALPRPGRTGAGGGRRAGPAARRRAATPAGDRPGGTDDGAAPGRQRALRRLRPPGRGDRGRAPPRRLGPRRRRLRALGGGLAPAPAPRRRTRGGRLVGHRRAQDAQRALRLRPGGRARTRGPACGHGCRGPVPDPRARGPARAVRQGAGAVAPRTRLPGLGGAPVTRPHRGRRPGRRPLPSCNELRRGSGRPRRHRTQRRRVHAGVRGLRRRRPHRRRDRRPAGGRHDVDDRLDLARPARPAGGGQQLVDHRRRRGAEHRGRTTGAGRDPLRRGRQAPARAPGAGSGRHRSSCAASRSAPRRAPR